MKIDLALPACTEELLFATVADDGLPVRHRAGFGGRGSTKSHSFARRLLLRGYEKPERILAAREIQKSIEGSVKALLDDLIPQMGFGPLNGDGFYRSQKYEILGRNGTTVDFAGLRTNVDSIKSMEGITLAYVNEARAVSQNSIRVLTPTIRALGSEIWWDWNPLDDSDPVDAMFRSGEPPPGSIVRQLNYPDNPWFGEPLKSEMEWDRRRDPDKYQHIWLGKYRRNSEARVFKNWREEDFEVPEGLRPYFGGDWGFSVDPTVLVKCYVDDVNRRILVDEEVYKVGCEIDDTPALFAGTDAQAPARWENRFGYKGLKDAAQWPIRADSARPEIISYMNKRGFRVTPAIKGAGSVEEGVTFLQNYEIVVRPACVHTIDELSLYSYKIDKLTEEVLPVLEDKKNHVIDSLRYALEDVRRQAPVATSASFRWS